MNSDLRLVSDKKTPEPPPSHSGGGGGNYDARLASLETRMQYLATKEDVQKLKVWVLTGILGGMGVAATIATVIIRAFS